MIQITDRISLDDRDVEERFVRSIGQASQNVRKEATAVELRLDLAASSLPADVKERLRILAGRTVTTDDVLLVTSRVHRSQVENRDAAHTRLVTLLKRAPTPPKKRRPTKPRRAVREERLAAKKRRSSIKAFRDWRRED